MSPLSTRSSRRRAAVTGVLVLGLVAAATGCRKPEGAADLITATQTTTGGVIRVAGWAVDRDRAHSTSMVEVKVDGQVAITHGADLYRPDIVDPDNHAHAYDFSFPWASGRHSVCVTALDLNGEDAAVLLRCQDVDVPDAPAPVGKLESVQASTTSTFTGVIVNGWAHDPVNPGPGKVRITIDGTERYNNVTLSARADITAVYPTATKPGYTLQISTTPGAHQVCAWSLRTAGTPATASLGCRAVTVAAPAAPIGALESAQPTTTGVTVAGWAHDPLNPGAGRVRITIDGADAFNGATTVARTDITTTRPAAVNPGFNLSLPAAVGPHTVCAYSLRVAGTPASTAIGCQTMTVSAPTPDDEVMFGLLNQHRTTAGAPAVSRCATLDRAAQDYAQVVADQGWTSHIGPDNSTVEDRTMIAGYVGPGTQVVTELFSQGTAADAANALFSSDDTTVSSLTFDNIGIGVVQGHWVVIFATGGYCASPGFPI